jgi:4-hydroxy-tetrahydrodipicolinate synthase
MHNHKNILYTAIVTPFLEEGGIDYPSFEKILRLQDESGNGIVLLGSTGEGLAIGDEEKREVVRFASSLGLKAPLMVGVGGFHLEQCLDWIAYCEKFPISSYLLVAPLYAKPGPIGQREWFEALLNKSSRPGMIYNVPSRTGIKLSAKMLGEVAKHPRAWAVKEASGSLAEFQDYRAAAPNLDFYSGDDGMTPFFATLGAKGLVSVAANVWPRETRRFVEQSLSLEHKGLFPVWRDATDALFEASNPIPVKAIMNEIGLIPNGSTRAPLAAADLASRARLKTAHANIRSWFESVGSKR